MEEYCPYCSCVTNFGFEKAISNKGQIICECCRKQIKACSICEHRLSGKHCDKDNCFEYNSKFEMKLEV